MSFGNTLDVVFHQSGAIRLTDNFLGVDRTIRSLTYNDTADAGVTNRLASSTSANDVFNLTFEHNTAGANAQLTVTSGAAGSFRIRGGGSIILNDPLDIVHNGSGDLLIERPITDGANTYAVAKSGTGLLTLTAANTFGGGFTLTGGRVRVGSNTAFGNGGTLALDGGALSSDSTTDHSIARPCVIGGNVTLGNATDDGVLTFNNTVNLGSAARELTILSAVTLSSTISGSGGSITKKGGAELTLAGANLFTGGVKIDAGTIAVSNSATTALGPAENATVAFGAGTTSGKLRTRVNNVTIVGLTTDASDPGSPLVENGAASAGTLTVNNTADNVFAGKFQNGGSGSLALVKKGGGALTLSGATSTFTGGTTIEEGSLVIGALNVLPTGGNVIMDVGSGTLQVDFGQTIAALSVPNASLATSRIVIANTKTLTVSDSLTVGGANYTTSSLAISGRGSLVVNGALVQAGTSSRNAGTLDMSGLNSFTAALGGSGVLRVGTSDGDTTASGSTMILASNSTITASVMGVGDENGGSGAANYLRLGASATTLNADAIYVGTRSGRANGYMDFFKNTGSLVVRAANGTGRATFSVAQANADNGTSADLSGDVDLNGHSVDLLVSTLTIAERALGSGKGTGSFSMNDGTLDVTTIKMAQQLGGGLQTATLNIGGGTVTVGSGGIKMAKSSLTRSATAALNFTGGTITMGGPIENEGHADGGSGSSTATLTLQGATLDMGGNWIGPDNSESSVTVVARSGTLRNVGQINGGLSTLTKTTSGTLTLGGTLDYTGPTAVNVGTLRLAGTQVAAGAWTLSSGTTLSGTGTVGGVTTISGNLSPGQTAGAIGEITVNGNTTWNSGSSWSTATDWLFDVGAANAADRLVINGNFVKGSGSAFRFDFGGASTPGTYTLVEWTGTTGFNASNFSFVNVDDGVAVTFQIVSKKLQAVLASCSTPPTVTPGATPTVCQGATSASLSFTKTGTPVTYSIDFNDAANTAGFVDVLPTALGSSPLSIAVPGSASAGTYNGVLTVSDSSGCLDRESISVQIISTPAVPGAITQSNPGGTFVCQGSVGVVYSISSVASATSYTWTVPNNTTIVSGQGTTSITMNWGTAAPGSAPVKVKAQNACGPSADRTDNFTVLSGVPGAPTAQPATDISLDTFVANWAAGSGTIAGYYLDVATSPDFTAGYVVSNQSVGATTYSLSDLDSGVTYYYRVRAYNACGSGPNSAVITVLTPQVLAAWDFSGLSSVGFGDSPLAPSTIATGHVTVVGLTRGPGLNTGTPLLTRAWGARGWSSGTASDAINAGAVATTVVQATSGRLMSFFEISKFDYYRGTLAPTTGVLQYSTNGTDFVNITTVNYTVAGAAAAIAVPIDLSGIAALQDVPAGTPVTFRFVNHGDTGNGAWHLYDTGNSAAHDFEIRGLICEIPTAFNVTGGGAYCSVPGTGSTVGLAGSQLRVTYQLYRANGGSPLPVGSPVAGTGSAINFGPQTSADTYTVVATRSAGECTQQMSGSAVVSVTTTPGEPDDLEATTNGSQTELNWTAPGGSVTGYNVKRSTTSDGTYTTVSGGGNVPGPSFLVLSGTAGVTYYYKVTALNGGCEGSASAAAEADWPGGCPATEPPVMANPGNKTVTVGNSLSHSVTAQETSPLCDPPTMTHSTLPTWMTATTNTSGTSATLVLGGSPASDDTNAYPITVTATDVDNLITSRTFIVYVGSFAEPNNGTATPPPSLASWSVAITDLDFDSGSDYDIVWNTSPGVAYDLYSASAFPGGSWNRVLTQEVATGTSDDYVVSHSGERTYHQVVPTGMAPGTNGVWGVITPTIPSGVSMFAPPLTGTDRAFNGSFGAVLGPSVAVNTEVYFLSNPDANNVSYWTTLRWNGATWVHVSGPNDLTLDSGQGFFISSASAATPRFSSAVGNQGTNSQSLLVGYNIISVSEGKSMAASTAFSSAGPVASFNEEQADQIILQNANGSWRRLIRQPTSPERWYDTQTGGSTTLTLQPGQAYYYLRRSSSTTVTF